MIDSTNFYSSRKTNFTVRFRLSDMVAAIHVLEAGLIKMYLPPRITIQIKNGPLRFQTLKRISSDYYDDNNPGDKKSSQIIANFFKFTLVMRVAKLVDSNEYNSVYTFRQFHPSVKLDFKPFQKSLNLDSLIKNTNYDNRLTNSNEDKSSETVWMLTNFPEVREIYEIISEF